MLTNTHEVKGALVTRTATKHAVKYNSATLTNRGKWPTTVPAEPISAVLLGVPSLIANPQPHHSTAFGLNWSKAR